MGWTKEVLSYQYSSVIVTMYITKHTIGLLFAFLSSADTNMPTGDSMSHQTGSVQTQEMSALPTLPLASDVKEGPQSTQLIHEPSPPAASKTEDTAGGLQLEECEPVRDSAQVMEDTAVKEEIPPDQDDTDSTSSRPETPKSHQSDPNSEETSPSLRTRRSGRKSPGAAMTPGLEGGPIGTRSRSLSGPSAPGQDRDGEGSSDQDGVTTRKRSTRHNAKCKRNLSASFQPYENLRSLAIL